MTDTGQRRRLGRGLEALLGPSTAEARADGSLVQLDITAIKPNPYQPRNALDEGALSELTESLKSSGLLQPIVVRPTDDSTFELIAGERRWRAAQRLEWKEISAVVREVDDRTLLTLALVENLQRDDLSPIDEARGYERLMHEFGASQSEVADVTSRNRTTVANALRLLKLPADVQALVHAGKLSSGHARALLQLRDENAMREAAELGVQRGMSVREIEAFARDGRAPASRPRRTKPTDPDVRRVEDALRERLKTDVFVKTRGTNSGRIVVNFYSNDDLARLLEIVLGEPFE